MKKFIAHRGLHNVAKENTIDAFKSALYNEDYAGFECDVWETQDKEFVIHHDPLAKGKRIKTTDSKKLDLPKLEEVLNLQTNKIILLEVKDPEMDYKVFHELLNRFPNQKIYVMSFYRKVLKNLKEFSPFYALGILNTVFNSEESSYKDYDFIGLVNYIVTPKLLSFFKKQSIEIFIYGLGNKKEYKYDEVYYIVDEK